MAGRARYVKVGPLFSPGDFMLGVSLVRVYDWDTLDGRYLQIGLGFWAFKVWMPRPKLSSSKGEWDEQ